MKYISFAIPCYNSQDYMAHAIESILPGGEDIEIIIVNDGSKDRTSEIAHEYMEKYPTIIKVVDKENGGHGDAVNSGLMHATGKYFKVVDSDDWVDEDALHKILDVLRHMEEDGMELDMLIANYVYEKVGATHKKVIHYRNVLPQDEIFRWDDMGHFRLDQYILMHSVIYRTDMLKLIQLHLPKHTFYVDNIYVYYPLPHVRKIYYMDVDFYRYFIGREDQSVNEKVMIKRLDQQIFVTKTMIDMYQLKDIGSKKLRQYMLNYLAIIVGIVAVVYAVVNTKGRKAFNSKLDKIEDKNEFYRQIVAPDVLELKEEQLLVAKDYVIVVDADVWIYDLHHMEKVEVGKQGNVKKTLFLTEPNGKRHAILSTTKGDGRQEAFDQVYYRLHDRLAV